MYRYILVLSIMLAWSSFALAGSDGLLPSPLIKSISADGADIVVTVAVPPGAKEAAIEMGNPLAGQPWVRRTSMPVDGKGGEVRFRLPKPRQMQLIRATASAQAELATAPSPELTYVTLPAQSATKMPDATASPSRTEEIVLHIRGRIDGGDKLTVSRGGILWEHVNWGWPEGPVSINGTQWTPSEKNLITTSDGSCFLPAGIDFSSARLQANQARDTVALEKEEISAVIYLNDTPLGGSDYDLELHLLVGSANPPPSPGTPATLKISATIDGSDKLLITQTEARWTHLFWEWPEQVMVNDIAWHPATDTVLKNEASTQFLPAGVNFSTARVLKKNGRDLAVVEPQPGGLLIHFADNPNGAALYELTIQFGESGK